MAIGLVGKKCGMTRVYTDEGAHPVTVLSVETHRVVKCMTPDNDGYTAVQLTHGEKNPSKLSKAEAGHFAKAEVTPGEGLYEFRISEKEGEAFTPGKEISLTDIFSEGQFVDVTGTSRGKGYAGTVKRHNFRTQDATHGNSLSHRVPGSIGQNQTPRRVFKGKKMSGRMGNEQCTVQNQQIVRIDAERGLILVKGAVPGAPNGMVVVKPAIKKQDKKGGNQ